MKSVAVLTFLLFLFNNPWYLVQIYSPSTIAFTFSALQTSMFVAGVLVFWLKDLAKFQPANPDLRAGNVVGKLTRKSLSNSPGMLFVLGIFYSLLVIDFGTLYMDYYSQLKHNPGFAYTHQDDRKGATKAIVWFSVVLLGSYYIWFVLALINNLRLIWKQDRSDIAMFTVSQVVHLLTIAAFLLGGYSQHFANGGLQCFFIGFVNLYIWSLCVLNYPVVLKKRATDMDPVRNDSVFQSQEIEMGNYPVRVGVASEEKP